MGDVWVSQRMALLFLSYGKSQEKTKLEVSKPGVFLRVICRNGSRTLRGGTFLHGERKDRVPSPPFHAEHHERLDVL